MYKVCYKVEFTLVSPLSIGTSVSKATDRDVLLDARHNPFIPASSLCGVYRSGLDEETANNLFGKIAANGSEDTDCKVRVYDATLVNDATISTRDNVRLEKGNKVAEKGGKFDCQIVETGAKFVSYLETISEDKTFEDQLESILAMVHAGDLRFGAKTTRGFGQMSVDCFKKEITSIEEWLEFDLFEERCWKEAVKVDLKPSASSLKTILLKLKVKDAISIREYFAEANNKTELVPDYKQLTLKGNGQPTIPASSWAGAFRARVLEFTDDETTNQLFGNSEKQENQTVSTKSKIMFSESVIKGGNRKILTRNAIDRLSGGAVDKCLYTEQTWYGGTCDLSIKLDPKQCDERAIKALFACILDLKYGFLSVGGLTSIGRGLFDIENASIQGCSILEWIEKDDISELYKRLKEGE